MNFRSPTTSSLHRCSVLETTAFDSAWMNAGEVAAAFAAGRVSAQSVVDAAFARIRARDPLINSFTAVTDERAQRRAQALDEARARGEKLPPLAGVPFAVKNLFDIAGLPTLAGSKINRDAAPAGRDATLIERLEANGAILLGALNMGEYAYDFTGENPHDGPARNPHDLSHMTGGSSSGSAAAVAGGLVPLALGSDTNGSIRVPASLCGLFGLKPTYGRLSRARTFPFAASFDHVGPLARGSRDLAIAYDAMQGHDGDDPVCADRVAEPVTPLLDRGLDGLRIAVAGGYFKCRTAEAVYAIDRVAAALGVNRDIEIPEAERARSAAYIITASEAASLHLPRLRTRAQRFRPRHARPADRRRHAAGFARNQSAEISPLVPASGARIVCRGRCHLGAGHAMPGAAHRPADICCRWRRNAGASQSRPLYPADLVHRPAGRCCTGTVVALADRRADYRRAVARGRGFAHRTRAGDARRRRRAASAAHRKLKSHLRLHGGYSRSARSPDR